jgi:adenine-specific DNA methylase
MNEQCQAFPPTRYQGSKYKLLPWLHDIFHAIPCEHVLDAFAGTGAVSYLFKCMGKTVHSNDALLLNSWFGHALIANDNTTLTQDDIDNSLSIQPDIHYDDVIQRNFSGIYFTDDENKWLDRVIQTILHTTHHTKRAMLFWCLAQSALSKRPYNLFHRHNLHLRTAEINRSFGNKTTWDRPFEQHFRTFAAQLNNAIFDNGHQHTITNQLASQLDTQADLVYIDPPYIPTQGSITRYRDFYHFLEGALHYHQWETMLDTASKHKKLQSLPSPWEKRKEIKDAFSALIQRMSHTTIAISYRIDGTPSIDELIAMLQHVKPKVTVHAHSYQYALSKRKSKEVLLIASE